jgi:hypothetical protein
MRKLLQFIVLFVLCAAHSRSQIANFVNNGGFEEYIHIIGSPGFYPKYWGATDTSKFFGGLFGINFQGSYTVPKNSQTYQYPRSGKNYLLTTIFCSNCFHRTRSYPRNRLKTKLEKDHIYCVKFYVNLADVSSYGISNLGAYFGNETLDTIKRCDFALPFLDPQVKNPNDQIITDTLNWILISGLYLANGSEKYLMLGCFVDNSEVNKAPVNPFLLPTIGSDYLFDDVSVIDINLPAYAGPDHYLIPGDSAFIGRSPDVGIDEACTWYRLPNDSVAIDTVAGLWVKPVGTATYVVRQEICGNVKWDTVLVHENPLGLKQLNRPGEIHLLPNPADDKLQFMTSGIQGDIVVTISVYNQAGICQLQNQAFRLLSDKLDVSMLPEGFYLLHITSTEGQVMKKLVVQR